MSFTRLKAVAFGSSKTALTPSYQLYDSIGATVGGSIAAGIVNNGYGFYSAVVAFPTSFTGSIGWTPGDGSAHVFEFINPGSDEYMDTAISNVVGKAGTGAFKVVVNVTDGTNPLQGAFVRMSEGVNFYTTVTDANGDASFALDAATYSVGISKSGYQFTPVSVIVTADANFNESMTAIVIPTPANPTLCNVFGTFVDLEGNPMAGITFTFTLSVTPPAKSGMIFGERVITASTNASGQLIDAANNAWISLARNDGITPSGSHYLVTCSPVHFNHKITLAAATFDLASLVT